MGTFYLKSRAPGNVFYRVAWLSTFAADSDLRLGSAQYRVGNPAAEQG